MKKTLLLIIAVFCFAVTGFTQCITGGTIGVGQTGSYNFQYICQESDAPSIYSTIPPTGLVGTPAYIWYISLGDSYGPWSIINGATNETYIPSTSSIECYRRQVIDASIQSTCNNAMSNVIIVVPRPIVYGGTIGSEGPVCIGTLFTLTNIDSYSAFDYSSTIDSFYWEESINNKDWSIIANATGSSFTTSKTDADTYYYRRTTHTNCGEAKSNVLKKDVLLYPHVSVKDLGLICAGTTVDITATTKNIPSTAVYQWYLDNVPVGTNSPVFPYLANINDTGKNIFIEVSSSDMCNNGIVKTFNMPIKITLSATPSVRISNENGHSNIINISGCTPTYVQKLFAYSTDSEIDPNYQWYENTTPVGTDTSIYIPQNVFYGDIWVEVTSTLTCLTGLNTFVSNKVRADIKPIPSPSITEGDQTVCIGSTATFHATTYAGNIVQWYYNGNIINGATNSTYTASQTGMYSIVEENSFCNVMTSPVSLTIDPCGAFSTTITGPNPITPGQQNARYSVFNQTGFTYDWSVSGGTIVSGGNTNEVTVDWDNSSSTLRTSSQGYTISVTETKPNQQQKTITMDVSGQSTGISKSLSQAGITLFPNPATDAFYIEMPESGLSVSYEILDVTGLSVANGTFTSSTSCEQITSNFGPGLYQVVLHYNNVVTVGRLSKVQ